MKTSTFTLFSSSNVNKMIRSRNKNRLLNYENGWKSIYAKNA